MATLTRLPRPVKPASGSCKLVRAPLYPGEILPRGAPGLVEVNGACYRLEAIADRGAPVRGYRLTKADGTACDVDLSCGHPSCDCPDATYRQRACKHLLAVLALRGRQL